MTKAMPDISMVVPRDAYEQRLLEIVRKGDGTMRATKPRPPKDATTEQERLYGHAAYVWRMFAFNVSPRQRHHCIPYTADFDLVERGDARRAMVRWLDETVKRWTDQVPMRKWHGVIAWGQAFGQIGTPRLAKDGSYVYRLEEDRDA